MHTVPSPTRLRGVDEPLRRERGVDGGEVQPGGRVLARHAAVQLEHAREPVQVRARDEELRRVDHVAAGRRRVRRCAAAGRGRATRTNEYIWPVASVGARCASATSLSIVPSGRGSARNTRIDRCGARIGSAAHVPTIAPRARAGSGHRQGAVLARVSGRSHPVNRAARAQLAGISRARTTYRITPGMMPVTNAATANRHAHQGDVEVEVLRETGAHARELLEVARGGATAVARRRLARRTPDRSSHPPARPSGTADTSGRPLPSCTSRPTLRAPLGEVSGRADLTGAPPSPTLFTEHAGRRNGLADGAPSTMTVAAAKPAIGSPVPSRPGSSTPPQNQHHRAARRAPLHVPLFPFADEPNFSLDYARADL